MAHIQKFVTYNQKTLKKTCSYYIMHIAIALLVGYFVTGSIWMALTLSLLEPTIQAIAFFFHEKVWEKNASNLQKSQNMTVQNIKHIVGSSLILSTNHFTTMK